MSTDSSRSTTVSVTRYEEIEKIVVQGWKQVTSRDEIGLDDDFFSLGGTSLAAAQLFVYLERQLGCQLPITQLLDTPTARGLVKVIHSGAENVDGPIVTLREGNDATLFLIHPIGGSALAYRHLANALPESVRVLGIQATGLYDRGEPKDRVEDIAEEYARWILSRQPQGPWRLAGYSAGGVLAFATAHYMMEKGLAIDYLGLINTHFGFRRYVGTGGYMRRLKKYVEHINDHGPQQGIRHIRTFRTYQRKLSRAEALLDSRGTTHQQRQQRIAEKLIRQFPLGNRHTLVRQLHQSAIKFYVPDVYRGVATLYRTEDFNENRGGEIGWRMLSACRLQVRNLPGTHLALLDPPLVTRVAESVESDLPVSYKKTDSDRR